MCGRWRGQNKPTSRAALRRDAKKKKRYVYSDAIQARRPSLSSGFDTWTDSDGLDGPVGIYGVDLMSTHKDAAFVKLPILMEVFLTFVAGNACVSRSGAIGN